MILRRLNIPDRIVVLTWAGLLLCTCQVQLIAQSSSTGIIQGTVLDSTSEEPLIAVNVSVIGTPYGTFTNAEGFYLLRNIPAGEQSLRFSYVGYREQIVEKVSVLPGLRTTINARLEPTTIEMEPVIVPAERVLIQRDITGTLHRVGQAAVQNLPMYSIQDLVELQPGVTAGGHIRGGRAAETVYVLDGAMIQDPTSGGASISVPRSAISEVNIHTGGFDAEFGNALSGVIQLVTRRGNNTREGMLRYDRDDSDRIIDGTEHSERGQAELRLSGPIVQDRLFYLIAADHTSDNTRWWQDFDLTEYPKPYTNNWNVFLRSDLYVNQALRISLEGVFSHLWERGYEWRWRRNLEGLPVTWEDNNRILLSLNHMISPTVFYDIKLSRLDISKGISEDNKSDLGSMDLWEYDSFLQYVSAGDRLWWFRGNQQIHAVQSSAVAQIQNHRLQVGFDLNYFSLNADLLKIEPQVTYYGLPKLGQEPLDFSYDYSYSPRTGSVYIQDTYESGNDLVIKAGFRYDWLDPRAQRPVVEWVPSSASEFEHEITSWLPASRKEMISPRIGLAFPIDLNNYVFVNYGEFFQVPLFDQMYSGLHVDLKRGHRALIGNPDLEHQRTKAYEVAVRRVFDESTVGSATLFYKESFNLIDTKTYSASDSKALEDGFTQFVNLPLARASGLEISFDTILPGQVGLRASYTYMTVRGHADTELSGLNYLQWGFEPSRQMYYLSWDQRHTVSGELHGDYRGFRYSIVGRFNTARPYTYAPSESGVLPEGTTVIPNNERMQEYVRIDLRISREWGLRVHGKVFTIQAFCDVRNLTDRKNVLWMASDGQIGGELGDPGAWELARRTRIGLEVRF
ncbi:TonB-dependent receptor domain-containing protein [Gemmatimonadota bacterium]